MTFFEYAQMEKRKELVLSVGIPGKKCISFLVDIAQKAFTIQHKLSFLFSLRRGCISCARLFFYFIYRRGRGK